MLSILINAYACSPEMGSEPGMAWNWCINLASIANCTLLPKESSVIKSKPFYQLCRKAPICTFITIPFPTAFEKCAGTKGIGDFINIIGNGNTKHIK